MSRPEVSSVPYEETLEFAWKGGWKVVMRCAQGKMRGMKRIRECIFQAELDMKSLVATRGRGFPMGLLASRLICPACGSRHVSVMFVPPAGSSLAGRPAAE